MNRRHLIGAFVAPIILLAACTRPPANPPPPSGVPAVPPPATGGSAVPAAGTQPISRPTPSGCITNVGPTNKMVVSGCGQDITYNVSVPSQCLDKACGLIFDVHGLLMNGTNQEQNTGIAAIGRRESYIVVQPNGPGQSWNNGNDAAVADFMALAIRVWKVETRRVHFTGYSMGGAMTLRMRCSQAATLASTAPMSIGGTSEDSMCATPVPVDTLYIQGTKDALVQASSRAKLIQRFVDRYGLGAGQLIASGTAYKWTRYTNATGFTFETLMHDYSTPIIGGHCFLGSLDPTSLFGCDQTAPFRHGQVVVDFFKAHPKR